VRGVGLLGLARKPQFSPLGSSGKASNDQKMPIFGCVDAVESLFRTRNSQFL
jgi:hypothetical protein